MNPETITAEIRNAPSIASLAGDSIIMERDKLLAVCAELAALRAENSALCVELAEEQDAMRAMHDRNITLIRERYALRAEVDDTERTRDHWRGIAERMTAERDALSIMHKAELKENARLKQP